MTKKQKADAAHEIVKQLGEIDQECACAECVTVRRKVAVDTIKLCVQLMAEDGR